MKYHISAEIKKHESLNPCFDLLFIRQVNEYIQQNEYHGDYEQSAEQDVVRAGHDQLLLILRHELQLQQRGGHDAEKEH